MIFIIKDIIYNFRHFYKLRKIIKQKKKIFTSSYINLKAPSVTQGTPRGGGLLRAPGPGGPPLSRRQTQYAQTYFCIFFYFFYFIFFIFFYFIFFYIFVFYYYLFFCIFIFLYLFSIHNLF